MARHKGKRGRLSEGSDRLREMPKQVLSRRPRRLRYRSPIQVIELNLNLDPCLLKVHDTTNRPNSSSRLSSSRLCRELWISKPSSSRRFGCSFVTH